MSVLRFVFGRQRSLSQSLFPIDLFFVLIVLAHRRNTESFTLRDAKSSPLTRKFTPYAEDHHNFGGPTHMEEILLSEAERHLRPASDAGHDQAGSHQERGRIA